MILQKCIILFMMLAIGGHSMRNVCIMVNYEINKKYIAEVLCENRDLPEMKCFGKCQLAKKLKKAKEKEANNSELLKELKAPVLFSQTTDDEVVCLLPGIKLSIYQNGQALLSRPHLPVFHPPSA